MSEPNPAPEEEGTAPPVAAATHDQQQQPEETSQEDNDAVAYIPPQELETSTAVNNKWSKNGYGAPVLPKKTGKFSHEESAIVKASVEAFCAAKQITVARLCSECDHKADLKGAWMEIAKCLPNRTVQSVYRHGIRRCHQFRRGPWTERETNMLTDLVQSSGKKWSQIQGQLNRSADSCRDKYREMSEDYVKGRWRETETELLKRYIREHLNADPTVSMKDLGEQVEKQSIMIPWSLISKRMGKRSRLSCFKKWQKMTGLTGPAPDGMNKREGEAGDEGTDLKRARMEDEGGSGKMFASAGAASAAAIAAGQSGDYDTYSAKMAAETVEAVDLPDTDALGQGVRDV